MTKSFPAILVLVGCVAGAVASQLVVPAARAGTNPTRCEYTCAKGEKITEQLFKFGQEGWEMVSTFVAHYQHEGMGAGGDLDAASLGVCFKRPL